VPAAAPGAKDCGGPAAGVSALGLAPGAKTLNAIPTRGGETPADKDPLATEVGGMAVGDG